MLTTGTLISAKRLVATFLLVAAALVSGIWAGRVWADQPHMQAALEHLRAAKQQLEVAEADKGGHRAKAIRLVNNAISEVEKGIHYDRAH